MLAYGNEDFGSLRVDDHDLTGRTGISGPFYALRDLHSLIAKRKSRLRKKAHGQATSYSCLDFAVTVIPSMNRSKDKLNGDFNCENYIEIH